MDMVQEELQLLKYRHKLASDLTGQRGGPQSTALQQVLPDSKSTLVQGDSPENSTEA